MKHQKRSFFGFLIMFGCLLTLSSAGVQAKPKVSRLAKTFASVQQLKNYQYVDKAVTLKVPGPRVKKTRVRWSRVPAGFPLPVVKALQAASLERMKSYAARAKQKSWKQLKGKRIVGKKVRLAGKVWWLFSEHRYASNRLFAYQPKSRVLFQATGMYARGRMPAQLRVLRYKSYWSLFQTLQKAARSRAFVQKTAAFSVLVKKPRYSLKQPVNWNKVPGKMDKAAVELLLPGGLGKATYKQKKPGFVRLNGSTYARRVWYKGKHWISIKEISYGQLFFHYLYHHKTRTLYTSAGRYIIIRPIQRHSIRGPFQLP